MNFEKLNKLNKIILKTKHPKSNQKPVINELYPSQKYLIISSDPSSDTDKQKGDYTSHSSFAERTLSLIFLGSDNTDRVDIIKRSYREFNKIYFKYFYWTHFSKTYARGNPDSFWADKFLLKEIELFEPKVIILFGNTAANFLFGKGKLIGRVNRILKYNGVTTICCLHPSKDWNLTRRDKYFFKETWVLIRKTCRFQLEDKKIIEKLVKSDIYRQLAMQ